MTPFQIRQESPVDYPEIYALIQTAFETAKVKDGDEQDFAAKLRESDNYIPELGVVAEADGKLIGHIMFTKTFVVRPDGSQFSALLVAPLSVLLEYRDKGVGSALMLEGFRVAQQLGYKAAILVGDPGYYKRFGYVQASEFNIRSKSGIPEQFVMIRELEPGVLRNVSGIVDCC